MSKAYSRASKKRRTQIRKKRAQVQKAPSKMTEQEKLFSDLSRKWGGGKLHRHLKKEKYRSLLKRISRGSCHPSEARKIIEGNCEQDTIANIFQVDALIPQLLCVEIISLPDRCLMDTRVMAIPAPHHKNHVWILYPNSPPLEHRASNQAFAVIKERTSLPADMRKWDPGFASMYLRATHRFASFGPTSGTSGLHPGKLQVGNLVQLRRTNPFPSSKQRRQEHDKSYEKRAQKIDVSFSQGQ